MRTRAIAGSVAALASLALLTGCGLGQQAADKAAEQLVEEQLGDGSNVEIGEDGSIKVESSDGSYEIGTGELPEGWPSDIPGPEGYTLSGGVGDTANKTWSATWLAEGDRLAEVQSYIDVLTSKGYAPEDTGGVPGLWSLKKGGTMVLVLAALDGGGGTSISVTVSEQ